MWNKFYFAFLEAVSALIAGTALAVLFVWLTGG